MKMEFNQREDIDIGAAILQSSKRYKGMKIFFDDKSIINPKLELDLPSLNHIISGSYFGPDAGFVFGKVYNFYGMESVGKTALAAQIAANVQRAGGKILWIDGESSFDPYAMKRMYGLDAFDTNTMKLAILNSMEEATDAVTAFVDSNSIDLYVIDSVTALGSAQINDADGFANTMGSLARRLSQHFNKIISKLAAFNISGIYINQMRYITKGQFWVQDATGGNAAKFTPHVSLFFKKVEELVEGTKDDQVYKGFDVKITAEKNKVSFPKRKRTFRFIPGRGFLRSFDIISIAKDYGIIEQKGAWVSIKDENGETIDKIQGFNKVLDKYEEDPEALEELWELTKRTIASKGEDYIDYLDETHNAE